MKTMEKKKLLHYSRNGYNGDLTYTSVCEKIVKTHQDHEGSTIYPHKANCPECLASQKYQIDLSDYKETKSGIKRRIYIESDFLKADEFNRAQRTVHSFAKENGLDVVERAFSLVLEFAWHKLDETWESVKRSDEIYAISSLMPLIGGSYSGAPVIFNGMCERAVRENVSGKSVFILNSLENIEWDMIDMDLMMKAFKSNDLYMYNENYDLKKVDITTIKQQ